MQQPGTYSYDDPSGYYGGEQVPRHPDQLYTGPAPPFDRAYQQPQGSRPYYFQPSGNVDVTQPDTYFGGITPMPNSTHRHSGNSQARYYQPSSGSPSSSQINPSAYPSQGAYLATGYPHRQHHPMLHTQTAENQFIPTPSELYNSYPPRQISVPPRSPTQTPYSIPAASLSRSPDQRPARISLSRPHHSPTVTSSSTGERFPCECCGKTFSRSHDRKRHYETQHLPSPVIHRCRYCEKEFSRADSLKRHLDNGCDEMPEN